ncbi:hypothetical protein HLH26_19870 [Gluconacetobacter sp. 1b LMG 1731]|uniref:Uncharacterized protein n=1 Tax=Gluconacetobacter dulcium TaxID=2729096 RepID=A0A7W4IPS6_9PROT|nr:hypothetical protein [Gluconacetobacter dulcium]MBB2166732.1 hypothetical protein [Gluconacetobacter dulcium]MBB2195834.1 hypothetical protein [Gluconacetobacter dulcium]
MSSEQVRGATDERLEEWVDSIKKCSLSLTSFSQDLELEGLGWWLEVMRSTSEGYDTNLKYLKKRIEDGIGEQLPQLTKAVSDIKLMGRKLSADRHPMASKVVMASSQLERAVNITKRTVSSIPEQAQRILDCAPGARSRVNRAIGIYQNALSHVLKKEGVIWEVRFFSSESPVENFPWFEVYIDDDTRKNRKKLRDWERRIDVAVGEVDPDIVGYIGINYTRISAS